MAVTWRQRRPSCRHSLATSSSSSPLTPPSPTPSSSLAPLANQIRSNHHQQQHHHHRYHSIIIASLVSIVVLSLSQSVDAVVPSPPTIIKQPEHEQLYQVAQTADETDKPFVLECEAQGEPAITYEWIKNGLPFEYQSYDKRISQQPRRGTLVFTKPDDVDEGLYQCRATNLLGTAVSNAVFLRKSELNSFSEESTKEVFVIEGDPLTLDCNPPTGYPRPMIFWLIQSNSGALRSFNDSRIAADPEGDLHFAHVKREDALDEAVYTCSATSHFRREYKIGNKIMLRVEPRSSSGKAEHPPTRQYTSPPNIVALRGQKLELFCIFGGHPLPQITWLKRGATPHQTSRFTYTNFGKTLQINSVDFEDEGNYECTANNGIGVTQSASMNVKVEAAPYFVKQPENTNAAEEESVSFTCSAAGIPDPKLQWFVNGVPVEKAEPNPRRKVEGNVLFIESLDKKDTANYQCNASNPHGYAFKDFYLNVLALPPTITEPPEPMKMAVVTSNVTLRCRVFGAPKPEVKWQKEGQELTGGRYKVLESGDLHITDLLVTDEGEYKCYASNKFGDISATGSLEVKGKTRITHPPEHYEVAAKKTATFRCNAEADPSLKLTIDWLFNGEPIDFEADQRINKGTDQSLTIARTIELDSGIYTCIAKTELDQDQATATLTVQDVPNSPQIIKVDCDTFTALVEWKPTGDRRAPILSYAIQYNTTFTPDAWEDAFASIPAPDTKFKVSMSPWANYTFRVIARNKIGPSVPSAPSRRCSTPEDVPHKNPDKVIGRGDMPTNLVISWTPMPLIEHNAPGFFYKVLWKRDDRSSDEFNVKVIEDWKQNRYVIYNQDTFKPYRIKVEAHNRRGQAHTSAIEVIGYSGEDVPAEAPRDFTLIRVIDSKSAEFQWKPVAPESVRGHFKGYKIQTWTPQEGELKLRELIVPPNTTQAVASIFKPFSRNVVRCMVFNEMYTGPPSEQLEFETPEGVPGPVASFEGIAMGSSGIYLIWKKPLEPNGRLVGYHIFYEEVKGTQLGPKIKREPPIRDASESRAKLAGLKPSTKYRLTMYAATKMGLGEPYFIEVTTIDESNRIPNVPDFLWTYLPDHDGLSSVQVTWLPAVTGHPGSHFFVQYRLKGEENWESTMPEKNEDTILVRGLETGVVYEMRVIAVDGKYQVPSKVEEVVTGTRMIYERGSPDNVANAAWFIGMMCAIALLLLLLLVVCLVKRNRGGKYAVHEKELAQRGHMEIGDEGGFDEYNKADPRRGSRTSLPSSGRGESETDSLAEYGDPVEADQFGEDGSFIGQYGAKKKREEQAAAAAQTTSPSALATFV